MPKEKRTAAHRKARCEYAKLRRKFSWAEQKNQATRFQNHISTLSAVKNRATKNNLPFDLDSEWVESAYAEAKKRFPKLTIRTKVGFWSADIDRIVPELGYVKTNCRLIPHALNVAKWTWNKEEVSELASMLLDEIS